MAILVGAVPVEDVEVAVNALQEVEAKPHLYLTSGSACRGYEALKEFVESTPF
jgi:hypothetical protein